MELDAMKLDETAIRAKVIELYDGRNVTRMNLWLTSGLFAEVLDADLVARVMQEELPLRAPAVQDYWLGPCDCGPAAHLP